MKHPLFVAGATFISVAAWTQLSIGNIPVAETHERRLQIGKKWIEIVGACALPETGQPSCWGWDGRLNQHLAKNVQNALNSSSDWTSMAFRPGKKNRLIVYRVSGRWAGGQVFTRIGTSNSSLWLHSEEWPAPKGQRYSIETSGTILAADLGDTRGVLRVDVTETVPTVHLPIRVGAEAIVGGRRVAVASVSAGSKEAPRFGSQSAKCLVRLTGDIEEYEVHLGKFLNPKGVQMGASAIVRAVAMPGQADQSAQFRKKVIKTARGYDIWLNVEPGKVDKVVFGGTRDKPVGIAGIPLDPLPSK